MQSRELLADMATLCRAVLANQCAKHLPQLYFSQTDLTGRGLATGESSAEIADYSWRCFSDYFQLLEVADPERFLTGKAVLEYGPGDFPGASLLMLAHGASRVWCVDRFPLLEMSDTNQQAVRLLAERLDAAQRQRLLTCFVNAKRLDAGLRPERLAYICDARGCAGLDSVIDFACSRAVLEHVNALPQTLADNVRALRPGGRALHLVDLRSHGHHRRNPLDFLRWPPSLWQLMHSAKGVPNRHRIDVYRQVMNRLGVQQLTLTPVRSASPEEVAAARRIVHPTFQALSDDDLACLGFWLSFERHA